MKPYAGRCVRPRCDAWPNACPACFTSCRFPIWCWYPRCYWRPHRSASVPPEVAIRPMARFAAAYRFRMTAARCSMEHQTRAVWGWPYSSWLVCRFLASCCEAPRLWPYPRSPAYLYAGSWSAADWHRVWSFRASRRLCWCPGFAPGIQQTEWPRGPQLKEFSEVFSYLSPL